MKWSTKKNLPIACLILLFAAPSYARAETLNQALTSAYLTDPRLEAARARLRAVDENVAQAKSGYRPTVAGSAEVSHDYLRTNPSLPGDGSLWPSGFEVGVDQPVFTGFQTLNAIREAEAAVRAERANLRRDEQVTLLEGVTFYMDVITNQAIVKLQRNNVNVLSRELKATKDRFSVGEVTRTDVAQSEARRARSISDLDAAQANLRNSRGEFERVVGHPPAQLVEPQPIDRLLPRTLEEAANIGEAENPTVVTAAFAERAAEHNKDKIRGEFLPTFDIQATYQRRFDSGPFSEYFENSNVRGVLSVPLYQAGDVSARVRQAEQQRQAAFQGIEDARVSTRSNVVTAWSELLRARAQLVSDRAEVEANTIALTGVREEEKVGQRTILDVLNAEQELLDSQVALVGSRRDVVIASYAVLASIGRLSVADLGLNSPVYDPQEYYHLVKRKWWGTRVIREEGYAGYAEEAASMKDWETSTSE